MQKIRIDLTGEQAQVTVCHAEATDRREAVRVKYRVPVIYDTPTRPVLGCYGRYWPAIAPACKQEMTP